MAVGQAFQPDNWDVRLESLTCVFGRLHIADHAFMHWKGQTVKVPVDDLHGRLLHNGEHLPATDVVATFGHSQIDKTA
jgi:hypothetical protein